MKIFVSLFASCLAASAIGVAYAQSQPRSGTQSELQGEGAAAVEPAESLVTALALEDARAAFEAGALGQAERLAAEAGTKAGNLLAAEAALTRLMIWEPELDREDAAERADHYADLVLQVDANLMQAHLRKATALGYRARFQPAWRAFLSGLPQASRDHLRAGLELNDDDPHLNAVYGAWNLEVVRRAGEGRLGASQEAGLEHFAKALDEAPDDVSIAYHFALAMLARGGEDSLSLARDALARAIDAAADDVRARALQPMAIELLALMDRDIEAARDAAVYRLEN